MRRSLLAIIALVAFVENAALARAGDPDGSANEEVLTRARPEYDARGVRLGSFFLYPSLTGGVGYADNVFNDASTVGDYFYAVAPALRLQSAWSRHALSVTAGERTLWYSNQESENRTDWNVMLDARIDVARGTEIKGAAHFLQGHDPRGTDLTGGLLPGDPAEPTEFTRTGFTGEFDHTFNRLRLSLGGGVEDIDYKDTPRVPPPGSAVFNNDDRDRTVTDLFAKAAVSAGADTALFVRGRWTTHDFKTATDDDGFNRDSSGWGIDGGIEFSMTHVLTGEIFGGYTLRKFDEAAFPEAAEVAFGAGLKWFPTMLTTVSLDGARTIEDTSIMAASGFVSTRGAIGIDHELLRNLILSGRLGYENAEYLEIARNDDILTGSVSGRLLINNNLHLDAGWEFIDRNSSSLPFEYSTGQFQLSLTGKL